MKSGETTVFEQAVYLKSYSSVASSLQLLRTAELCRVQAMPWVLNSCYVTRKFQCQLLVLMIDWDPLIKPKQAFMLDSWGCMAHPRNHITTRVALKLQNSRAKICVTRNNGASRWSYRGDRSM